MAESEVVISGDFPLSPPRDRPTVRSCKGAAIQGSSLLSTLEELRSYFKSGQIIRVNGIEYLTHSMKTPSAWPAKCIELNGDFTGETDFNATIEWELLVRDSPMKSPAVAASAAAAKQKYKAQKEQAEASNGKVKKPHRLAPINRDTPEKPEKEVTPSAPAPIAAPVEAPVQPPNKKTAVPPGKPAPAGLNPLVKADSFKRKQKKEREDRVIAAMEQQKQSSGDVSNLTTTTTSTNQEGENGSGSLSSRVEDGIASTDGPQPPEKPLSKAAEARRIARERVLRKLKEDKEEAERIEKEKEDKITKLVEGNQIKIKKLQEKTAERVQQYQEQLKYKAIEERSRLEEEEYKRFQANQQAISDEAQQKMLALRKECSKR